MNIHFDDRIQALAERILRTTAGGRRYKISREASAAEFDLLRGLDRQGLEALARRAECHVVIRMGGSVVEFTRAGTVYSAG